MYTLFCSFDKYSAWKLYKQLQKVGVYAFSISTVLPESHTVERIWRQYEDFDRGVLKSMPDDMYYICQLQDESLKDNSSFISPYQSTKLDKEPDTLFAWSRIIITQHKSLIIPSLDIDLYYDEELNICSIPFEGSTLFDHDKQYNVDLNDKKVTEYVE